MQTILDNRETDSPPPDSRRKTALALLVVGLFLAAHCLVPLVGGDLYPFTTGPMFRDSPHQYCEYQVFDSQGRELDRQLWNVQRVYDGNPVGYGVGLQPPHVLEQEFGVIPDEAAVRRHFASQMQGQKPIHLPHEVLQQIIGPKADGSVGVIQEKRISLP